MGRTSDRGEKKFISKFVGNTGWMIFKNIYSMLVSLVVGSLSARYLGPANFGLLNYGSSIIAFFTIVSRLGMDSVVVAEIAREPKKENTLLGTALTMRLITSVLSLFMIWGIVCILEPGNTLLHTVTVLQAIAIIFQSVEVLYFWFQVHLNMKYVTIAAVFALTAAGAWRITLLANAASVQWFALSASVSALVSGTLVVAFFLKQARIRIRFSKEDAKYIWEHSYHFIISGLAVTLYTQLDRIMLGKMYDSEAVGIYAAASTVAVMWEFVPVSIINSSRPILVKLYEKNRDEFVHWFRILLLGVSIMGLAVGVFFTVLAKPIIMLLYGERYLRAASALAILIWSTSFAMIGEARGVWIVSERLNKYVKWLTISGAVLNATLNVLIIPTYGVMGAAFTTLISQIFVSLIVPAFIRKTRRFITIYFGSFRCIPDLIAMVKKRL